MELQIEYIDKEQLRPYRNNAKIHTDEQVKEIKESIKEFGFNDPIAVWRDNEIIEGHGRLLAVMQIKDIKQVPIIRLDDLTDEQRKAYTLIHNKLTKNTPFDIERLESILSTIDEIDMSKYNFDKLEDIADELENFFNENEQEEEQQTIKETDKIKFVITPNEEQLDDMITFFQQQGVDYETA